ncbi:hypothetical protein BpHYR1_006310 [Brachionus plicatilis]|uniref:Uncharacterized protein n=1 Tax=Brachionus plicatilis TaxID=10195 RepID=A0A3M7RLU7_BRAPC|nr:hypothetical protein BpHYR1_006310 [Brachionus plicatilis]
MYLATIYVFLTKKNLNNFHYQKAVDDLAIKLFQKTGLEKEKNNSLANNLSIRAQNLKTYRDKKLIKLY